MKVKFGIPHNCSTQKLLAVWFTPSKEKQQAQLLTRKTWSKFTVSPPSTTLSDRQRAQTHNVTKAASLQLCPLMDSVSRLRRWMLEKRSDFQEKQLVGQHSIIVNISNTVSRHSMPVYTTKGTIDAHTLHTSEDSHSSTCTQNRCKSRTLFNAYWIHRVHEWRVWIY